MSMSSYLPCFLVCLIWVLLILSASHSVISSKPLCHPHERLILLNFRNSFTTNINGPMNHFCPYPVEIIRTRSLTVGNDCCQWNWINCDASTGHVVNIDLHCSGLNGSISASLGGLFRLPRLGSLSLSLNYIAGELPSSIDGTDLSVSHMWELNLGFNLLSGRIPSWISNLPLLLELNLSSNRFTGSLVHLLGNVSTSLQSLYLGDNEFYGSVDDLMLLSPNLTRLDVSSNNLNGTIKLNDIFSKFINLRELDLSNNNLNVVPTNFKDPNSTWPSKLFLGLSSCNLGQFPFLGPIGKLQLNLSNNSLQGEIPEWFYSTSHESSSFYSQGWLDISHNSLTGGLEHLPWDILNDVDISFNLFHGTLPKNAVINGEMNSFVASNNMFSGQIDATIWNTTSLAILNLSNNTLSGIIPHSLLNSSPSLSVVNLKSNKLQGSIPRNISNCNLLLSLDLSNNQLAGKIPLSLAQCTSLKALNLGNNQLKGSFPYWLSSLAYLEVLSLRSNYFYGSVINSEIEHPFPKLQILDISNNNFTGKMLPRYIKSFTAMRSVTEHPGNPQYMRYNDKEYFSVELTTKGVDRPYAKIITTLVVLDFSNNKFDGEIPDSVGQLVALRGLNLSHNHLTRSIPPSLGNLTSLDSLDLSCNNLTGNIPQELVRLTFLEDFNVSENELVGLIPHGSNFNTFTANAYQGNPGLCGFPLTVGCVNSEEPEPEPGSSIEEEDDDGDDDGESLVEGEIVVLGYLCGTVVGMAWAYYMFSAGKPYWFIKFAHMMEVAILGFVHPRFGGMHGRRRVTSQG